MTIVSATGRQTTRRGFWLGFAAYLVPTFPLGYLWHLVWFETNYHALGIYRPDPIIPLGLASMLIQAVVFSWAYPRLFDPGDSIPRNGLRYGIALALLSWSFTTLAVAAKHPLASIADYLVLETAFTVVQFLVVGPLIALAHRN